MKTSSSVTRSFSKILTGAIVACSLIAAGTVNAQWSENFDSYANGSQVIGQGGWAGWDNSAAAGALVSSAFALSPPNSVAIAGGSDLVQQYAGYASGVWTYTSMQYIPSSLTTGSTYFILLNQYAPNTTTDHWSIQTVFNLATGLLYDDNGYTSLTNAIVRDAWVPLAYQIDLTANTVTAYYNGVAFTTHAWQDGTGLNQIQAVDLFANNAGAVYYDNFNLAAVVPEPTFVALLAAFGVTFAVWRRRSARS